MADFMLFPHRSGFEGRFPSVLYAQAQKHGCFWHYQMALPYNGSAGCLDLFSKYPLLSYDNRDSNHSNRAHVFTYRIPRMGTTPVYGRLNDCRTQDFVPMAYI